MALNGSGPLSIGGSVVGQSINLEFGLSATQTTSMSQLYRNGGLVTANNTLVPTSGAISLSNFYNAQKAFVFTISSNQTNANLRSLAVSAGWDQSTYVIATINAGVFIYSTSVSTPGLTISGSFPSGVQLVNNGFIFGMGGAGGDGGAYGAPVTGASGGTGLSVSVSGTVINNNNIIAGGGGGGGGGGGNGAASGGGGGGGAPYGTFGYTTPSDRWGDNGSSAGLSSGGNGGNGYGGSTGGSGGSAPGVAGGASTFVYGLYVGSGGGGGGGPGAAGGSGNYVQSSKYGNLYGAGGGSAGAAVSGNSNIIWNATGTRYGAIT